MLDVEALSEMMAGIIAEEVEKAVGPLKAENDGLKSRLQALEDRPAPETIKGDPGESVDPEAVNKMVIAAVSKTFAEFPVPKDGKDAPGFSDVLKDNGELVIVLQDGTVRRTGIRDGEKGKDGFNLEDFDAQVLDDDRTIEFKFVSGEIEHVATLKWPTMIYRGVFKEGEEYQAGDTVTWGGCLWHCDLPTKDKPGTESWTLAAKKGRDGKDAKNG